jgi:hypothetical protein
MVADYGGSLLIIGLCSDKLALIDVKNYDQLDKINYVDWPISTEGTGYEDIRFYNE